MESKQNPTVSVPAGIQKFFNYSVIAAFSIEVGTLAYYSIAKSSTFLNLTLNAYRSVLLLKLIPVAFFLIAYCMYSRKTTPRQRFFESLVVAVATTAIWGMTDTVLDWLGPLRFTIEWSNVSLLTSVIFGVVLAIVISAGLSRLRRAGRW